MNQVVRSNEGLPLATWRKIVDELMQILRANSPGPWASGLNEQQAEGLVVLAVGRYYRDMCHPPITNACAMEDAKRASACARQLLDLIDASPVRLALGELSRVPALIELAGLLRPLPDLFDSSAAIYESLPRQGKTSNSERRLELDPKRELAMDLGRLSELVGHPRQFHSKDSLAWKLLDAAVAAFEFPGTKTGAGVSNSFTERARREVGKLPPPTPFEVEVLKNLGAGAWRDWEKMKGAQS